MSIDKTAEELGILHGRRVTGGDFWKLKIKDEDELKTRYCEYQSDVEVNDKVVFYESMSGARMMDSPYAVFKEVFNDPAYSDFHHVWSVRSPSVIPAEYKDHPRVSFVMRNTDAHIFFLNRSKYLVGNSVQPDFLVRRPEQKFLNTWHGIAYKTLGRDDNNPLGAAASVYSLLQATHVLTPCEFMTEIQLDRFSMRGVYSGDMAEIGYPRQDLTINLDTQTEQSLRTQLNLDPDKKTVLYAPTWRGQKGGARFDASHLEDDIAALSELDANVVFLAHHIMLRHIKNVDFSKIIVPPANVNTNELLGIVDLLVTDYSSIFFDYMVTDHPIVHYLYDYEEYESERGLTLQLEELPGPVVRSQAALKSVVTDLIQDEYIPSPTYLRARDRFCPHDDGHAAERTKQWFFNGSGNSVKHVEARTRPTVVFWGGRLDKSNETKTFLDQLKSEAKAGTKDVTLFVPFSVQSNQMVIDTIRQLGSTITVVARKNYEMAMTEAEKDARANKDSHVPAVEKPAPRSLLKSVLDRVRGRTPEPPDPAATATRERTSATSAQLREVMYEREYRRVFGDAKFDEVVVPEGISRFWQTLAKHAR
ncbi:CDP-glycerol glycerophosphotransferase family protein [Brevibacterium aurantiacum]|uniref:CDP-glycerol glycerophosphotransferase family protein n=1 Tax=Brevibacterium aurantiacum TaxID=273384 RepID=UPI0018669E4C|nr:CDP-glycerol glycerophosphotransferase family protein [Brevibacterium aurantiacum]